MLERFTTEMTIDEAIKDLEKIKKVKFTPTNVPVSIDMAIEALKGVRDDDNEDALLKLIGSNEHLKLEKVIPSIKVVPSEKSEDSAKITQLEKELRDCRNELCLKCGEYQTKHLGSCNGCRWE